MNLRTTDTQPQRVPAILILGVQARLISSVEAIRHVFGLTSPPQPLPSPSVAPPDTHRRFNFNLRCVSGGAREGIWCGAGRIEFSIASAYGALTYVSGSHEGSDWFEIGHGGSRLGNAGRRSVTLVVSVNICGCKLYSLCKRHSPKRVNSKYRMARKMRIAERVQSTQGTGLRSGRLSSRQVNARVGLAAGSPLSALRSVRLDFPN